MPLQPPQQSPLPVQKDSRRFSSNSRTSSFRLSAMNPRICLITTALVLVAGIIVGIIFAAQANYSAMGGQGWLFNSWTETPESYLPLRKVEEHQEHFSSLKPWLGWMGRVAYHPPFYVCGDQQNSCEAQGQPNVCCPVTFVCHPTPLTTSGIFCCNSTKSVKDCHISTKRPPKCLPSTIECSVDVGGGCCPNTTRCSSNGCIGNLDSNSLTTSSSLSSAIATTTSNLLPSVYVSSIFGSITGASLTTLTGSATTESIAATSTGPKEGEVPQSGGRMKKPVVGTVYLPYSAVWGFLVVTALMATL